MTARSVSELAIRSYTPADGAGIVDLWDRSIGDRYPLSEDVLRQCLDRNPSFLPGDALVALDDGRPVGFAYLGRYRVAAPETLERRRRAWLQAVVVDASWRRHGVGRSLVAQLARPLLHEGVERVDAGGGSFYFWPGFPEDLPWAWPFGEALGFEQPKPTWDLRGDVRALDERAAQATLERAGLRLGPANASDRADLLDFLFREFGAEWWHETTWFLDEGGDPADLQLLRDPATDDAIIGLARLHTPTTRPIGPPHFWAARRSASAGGLGPIGVAEARRGHGLGLALLTVALARLRDQGLFDVVIDFTTLLGFYGHLGFEPWMSFRQASLPTHRLIDAGG
jgi:GNAT superfamily N-acetyltransferase